MTDQALFQKYHIECMPMAQSLPSDLPPEEREQRIEESAQVALNHLGVFHFIGRRGATHFCPGKTVENRRKQVSPLFRGPKVRGFASPRYQVCQYRYPSSRGGRNQVFQKKPGFFGCLTELVRMDEYVSQPARVDELVRALSQCRPLGMISNHRVAMNEENLYDS